MNNNNREKQPRRGKYDAPNKWASLAGEQHALFREVLPKQGEFRKCRECGRRVEVHVTCDCARK